jgi:predicted dehydrogenase
MRKVQLVGVTDVNAELGNKVARQYEVPYYSTVEDLLAQVDAVALATPTQHHYEQALMCIDHGVHTLIEKPIANSLEEAEAIADAADQSNLVVQVGHIERFNPAYIELKNVIEEMPPLAISIHRLSPFQGSNLDVDVVLDLMVHDTNLILDLVGRQPFEYDAYGLTAYSGVIDHAVVQLCFENGPVLTATASRVTEHKVRKIDVTCRVAYVECDLLNKTISIHRSTRGEYLNSNKKGVKYRQESVVERINVPTFEPLFLQGQHFVDSIIEGSQPAVSARDGYHALRLVVGIQEKIMMHLVNMDRRKTPRNGQTNGELEKIAAGK